MSISPPFPLRWLSAPTLLLTATMASAQTLHYVSPLNQASWQSSQAKHRCELNHEIPGFGLASFSRTAISGVGFSVRVQEATRESGEAQLQSIPPAWQPLLSPRDFGVVVYQAGKEPISLGDKTALTMLAELERGMQITFTPKQWDAVPAMVSFTLSTVNFRDALTEFRGCMAALPHFDFETLRNSQLLFATDSSELTDSARQRLDRLVDYVLLDDAVSAIQVEGHTDNVSTRRYNRKLSRQRAEAVRDYLLQKQLPAGLIRLTSFGEVKPVASNRTENGRSRNRRVMVSIVR